MKTPPPEIITDADITALSSFRLPARARELILLNHPDQLGQMPPTELRELMLGGGSNTVFIGDWPGRILLNRLSGVSFEPVDDEQVLVTAAGGENWHRLVVRCIRRGLHGLENLIMIPGSVGAAPMQNIGAYGIELAEVFERLRAWDRQTGRMRTFEREDCAFAYRDSYFKSIAPERFLITSVTVRVSRRFQPQTGYASLKNAMDAAGIRQPTPEQLAAHVMRLRRHRLPDPARMPNAGSFFKNPVLEANHAEQVLRDHPDLPHWPMPDGDIKLGAGAMIERLGWKGRSVGDAAVYDRHALVLVNRGQAKASDLKTLIQAIIDSVQQTYGLRLEPEPRLMGPQTS
ncbi:UDP-N-acetylmuramate dehydrogenase [Wenzhouxiangella sp. AB-CW3]|uniref:UDP-N-acetylmuramate dehydrogenase n=1 Tax=Wenzhouxiangella sp. AB-CW3 TaxID=2771012 RepID=UPI00168BA443|nr:UDP-N-acetylmuramate dehydrogenase [Wenzhouxiangella sp. AB-CW3]QOC23467.1 UDP-N-acetylmuramate dehydrogenase [Wenzhouxiangella sp. AB-CW3]